MLPVRFVLPPVSPSITAAICAICACAAISWVYSVWFWLIFSTTLSLPSKSIMSSTARLWSASCGLNSPSPYSSFASSFWLNRLYVLFLAGTTVMSNTGSRSPSATPNSTPCGCGIRPRLSKSTNPACAPLSPVILKHRGAV